MKETAKCPFGLRRWCKFAGKAKPTGNSNVGANFVRPQQVMQHANYRIYE